MFWMLACCWHFAESMGQSLCIIWQYVFEILSSFSLTWCSCTFSFSLSHSFWPNCLQPDISWLSSWFPFLFVSSYPLSVCLSLSLAACEHLQSSLLSSLFPSFPCTVLFPLILSSTVGRGPMEPPGGQGEMERSGGPHSDSGSISPTWDRDRRGPLPGPPGPPGPLGPPGMCVQNEREKL